MSDDRAFDRALDDWLADGSDWTPQAAVDAVLLAVKTTPQERDLRIPWRTRPMTSPLRLAAAIAIVAVAGFAALSLIPRGSGSVGAGTTPSPTFAPTPPPTATPSATTAPPSATSSPTIDTTAWTTYTSKQYGFTVRHPAGWAETPATRDWTFKADADFNPESPGTEHFYTPADGGVGVSVFAVAVEPRTEFLTSADLEPWIEEYCRKTKTGPCTGIHDRAVPLCLERRDCHPGLLVPFTDEVQAFFTNGAPGEKMVVVAVWRPESEPYVAQFGGPRGLLEGILSTMCVWPENARPPFALQIPGC
jgi:hypothetical protein